MSTFLLIGLGNPGKDYARNRHNVGFMTVDEIALRHHFSPWTKKFRGQLCEGAIGGQKVLLLKPQTYMNLSGESVGEAVRFYKIPLENVVVIHDELDFDFGTVKLKRSGGNAGHNGLESIESHIGKDFFRVRFGIGKTNRDNANHVLSDFSKKETAELPIMLAKLADVIMPMLQQMKSMGANNLKIDLLEVPQMTISASAKGDPGLRRDEK